jgi:hypothetical protein
MFLDLASCKRRREEDPSVTFAIIEINRDDEFLLPEVLNIGEMGTAAIRQGVAGAVCAGTPAGDAVGISKCEEQPRLRRATRWSTRRNMVAPGIAAP